MRNVCEGDPLQRGPIDRASSKGTCSVDPSIPSSADVQNPLKGGERLSYRRIAARIAESGFLLELGHATSFGVLREMLIKLSRLHTFNQSVEKSASLGPGLPSKKVRAK